MSIKNNVLFETTSQNRVGITDKTSFQDLYENLIGSLNITNIFVAVTLMYRRIEIGTRDQEKYFKIQISE